MSVPAEPLTNLTDGEWHRLHPATPLLRGGIFIVAVIGFVIANLRERLIEVFFGGPGPAPGDPLDEIYRRGAVGWAILGVLVILVVIMIAFYLSWRMHTFRVSDEVVEVRSGLVFRSHRKARIDRIQGVSLVRPLIPRLLGAARLEVSVAGQDGNVQLAYLSGRLADNLRRDILRLASGARVARSPAALPAVLPVEGADRADSEGLEGAWATLDSDRNVAAGGFGARATDFASERVNEFLAPELDPDSAPPESVVRIPPGRLIGSILLSGFTIYFLLAVGALIVAIATGYGSGWLAFAILPGAIGAIGFFFSRVTKSLRYSIAGTPDGVRVGFGLLSTSSETLPPGRIHAIRVAQPILWRGAGWWQVRINTAGHSSTQGAAGEANTTILPVGTREDVARVLELILPGFDSAEQRALVERGMLGTGTGTGAVEGSESGQPGEDGFTNAPPSAVWLRPFSWRRTGYALSNGVALIRRGVVSRDLIVVPLARLQSVAISQGPIKRKLGLATARLHTVAGPVFATLGVMGVDEAVQLFERVGVGAVLQANSDTTDHWNRTAGATP